VVYLVRSNEQRAKRSSVLEAITEKVNAMMEGLPLFA